jgi:hypothetical protein
MDFNGDLKSGLPVSFDCGLLAALRITRDSYGANSHGADLPQTVYYGGPAVA